MKLPRKPPKSFTFEPEHIKRYDEFLWRIFRTRGDHALKWDELRHFGPVKGMRFDPHPLPTDEHPESAVMYASTTLKTAFAEVYQYGRVVDRAAAGATLVSWRPTRTLELLDLTGDWPVQNGAASAIMMGPKAGTQNWARAIDERLGKVIDGLYHQSAITNEPMVTLFSRAESDSSFPERPGFRTLLDDSAADEIIFRTATQLKYGVV